MWFGLRSLWTTRGSLAAEAAETLQHIVQFLIFGTCATCAALYVFVASMPWWPASVPNLWVACIGYGAACVLALRLLRRNLLAGQVVWLLGWAASATLLTVLQHDVDIAILLALLPLLAALLIGWPAAALAEVALAALLWLPPLRLAQGFPAGSSTPNLIMVTGILGAVLGWCAAQPLTDMVLFAVRIWEHAHRTVGEARDQRMEMKQVQEDLVLANQELSRLSDKLKQMWQIAQEARQAKAEFVANVSHELRTPLNMIIGFAELMIGVPRVYGRSLPPTLLADIGAIHANAQHLARLVDDILDLSQMEAGRMALSKSWVHISDIISEATQGVRSLYESKGLYIHTHVSEDLPPLYCDATRVRQVLLNLLSNAGRFMEQGGVCIRAERQANGILVSVADTGPGIPAADLPRLFQPFSQLDASLRRSQGGSGLGLAISKQFVEMHEGRMWVESEVGVGTTFFFSLPSEAPLPADLIAEPMQRSLSPDAELQVRTRRFKAPVPQSLPRLVVIEKQATLSRLLERYMDDALVERVQEAEEAMDLLRRVPASAVLVDGLWPGDRTLLEKEIASLPSALPLITCWFTGGGLTAEGLGIARYLPKPVTRARLLSAVEAVGKRPRTILLVDDEAQVLRLFARILNSAEGHYRILRATTGARALHLMSHEQPDLVILDLAMPGMDGLQVLRLKAADPAIRHIPVIVTSAKGLSSEPVRAERIAVSTSEGMTAAELLTCIRTVVGITPGGKRAADPARRETPAG